MVAALPGVRIGARVRLLLDSDDEYNEHPTRIEDMDGDVLSLPVPLHKGMPVWPVIGDGVEVVVPPADAHTPELFLVGQVIGRQTVPDELIQVLITAAGQQQRRQYYRCPIKTIPLDCCVWEREFGQPESEGAWAALAARVVNVSGGGIGLEVDREVLEQARVHVRFPWPTGEGAFSVDAIVRNVKPVTAGRSSTRYTLGCEFRGLTRQQRERILQYIHRFQVEQRRLEGERERERERLQAPQSEAREAGPQGA